MRFSYTYHSYSFAIVAPRALILKERGLDAKLWTWVTPFSWDLWVVLGCSVVFSGVVFYLLELESKTNNDFDHFKKKTDGPVTKHRLALAHSLYLSGTPCRDDHRRPHTDHLPGPVRGVWWLSPLDTSRMSTSGRGAADQQPACCCASITFVCPGLSRMQPVYSFQDFHPLGRHGGMCVTAPAASPERFSHLAEAWISSEPAAPLDSPLLHHPSDLANFAAGLSNRPIPYQQISDFSSFTLPPGGEARVHPEPDRSPQLHGGPPPPPPARPPVLSFRPPSVV